MIYDHNNICPVKILGYFTKSDFDKTSRAKKVLLYICGALVLSNYPIM